MFWNHTRFWKTAVKTPLAFPAFTCLLYFCFVEMQITLFKTKENNRNNFNTKVINFTWSYSTVLILFTVPLLELSIAWNISLIINFKGILLIEKLFPELKQKLIESEII